MTSSPSTPAAPSATAPEELDDGYRWRVLAVALFCSSLTRSQVVAAVAAFGILCLITVLPWFASAKASLNSFWRSATDQGVMARYVDFSKGVLDTGNLVYVLATTAVFLFLTVKVMEARRWK